MSKTHVEKFRPWEDAVIECLRLEYAGTGTGNFRRGTIKEDCVDHIDFLYDEGGKTYGVDVKTLCMEGGQDFYVEAVNARGQRGSIEGKADYILFVTPNGDWWFKFPRQKLKEAVYSRTCPDGLPVSSETLGVMPENERYYKRYFGKSGFILIRFRYADVKDICERTPSLFKKYPETVERIIMESLKNTKEEKGNDRD